MTQDANPASVSALTVPVQMTVNGSPVSAQVSPRMLLSDFIRHELRLTGTHVGCEHGVCGACTIQLDGRAARSCLTLAIQADGASVRTVEDLESADGELGPVQRAFKECHGLQCGFCTPGFMMSVQSLIDEGVELADAPDADVREHIAGNLCRCTGYQNIVAAARRADELNSVEGTE